MELLRECAGFVLSNKQRSFEPFMRLDQWQTMGKNEIHNETGLHEDLFRCSPSNVELSKGTSMSKSEGKSVKFDISA